MEGVNCRSATGEDVGREKVVSVVAQLGEEGKSCIPAVSGSAGRRERDGWCGWWNGPIYDAGEWREKKGLVREQVSWRGVCMRICVCVCCLTSHRLTV